jgi:hypothetical protein
MKKCVVFKQIVTWSFAILFLITGLSISLVSQEHQRIVEKVEVTNIEVPVRVLYKGKPVTDLTIEDFTLYEGRKKMTINGFYKKSKTLTFAQPGGATETMAPPQEPRTFVLVFNVSNYNRYFEKAVNHLFTKILTPHDRLLILANDKVREFKNLPDREKVKNQLVADLKSEGKKAKQRLLEYISRVENFLKADDFRTLQPKIFRGKSQAEVMIDFLKKYQLTWTEYQQTYLIPRVDRFYYFSRYLEKLRGQKWVLNFYQFEFFPRIRPGSQTMNRMQDLAVELTNTNNATMIAQGRKMNNLLNEINSDRALNKRFPNEEITKLFYKVDATFHSFFINSSNTAYMEDISYKEISSDVEQVLKGITDATGGRNIRSTDLVASLDTVAKVDDTYYVLTYVPESKKSKGKLKIKVKNKRYKVLYDDNFRADYIDTYFSQLEQKIETPDVKIKSFTFKEKLLAFCINSYLMRVVEGKKIGRMNIRIRVTDKENKPLYDKSKILTANKNEINISLPTFKTIIKGEYNFLLDVVDMITGKKDSAHQNVIIE